MWWFGHSNSCGHLDPIGPAPTEHLASCVRGPGWTMPLAQRTPKHWKPTRRDLEGREATRGGERLCMSYSLQAGLTRGSGCPRQQGWGLLWVVGEAGRGAHKTASLPAKPPPLLST